MPHENKANTIRFDYQNNQELKALFSGKRPGDSVNFMVNFQVQTADEDRATGHITEVVDMGTGDNSDGQRPEPDEFQTDAESPVMIVLAGNKRPSDERQDES